MPGTVPAALAETALREPKKLFCTFLRGTLTERITFGELYERSCAYARHYFELGITEGDVVLVILKHTPHLFYAYIGAMIAGAIPSYLPFPTPKQRVDLYWKDHGVLFDRIKPRLIVTYAENAAAARDTMPDLDVIYLIADDAIADLAGVEGASYPGLSRGADDIACLQHSSGTTSLKKGVMLTHRMLFEHVAAYNAAIGFGADDSIASWLPLYHDMGFVACFMASLLSGTHLIALDPFEWVVRPLLLLDAIERYRATFCWLPNFAFSHIVNAARSGKEWELTSIRAFINCSEPCKAATFERFAERFERCGIDLARLQVCYAMAENVFGVTQTVLGQRVRTFDADADEFSLGRAEPARPGSTVRRILSCGPPIAGVEIEIRDDASRPILDSTVGEICVKSPFLFSGYYKLPERSAERLSGGWYRTSDMGFVRGGELFVTGRKDDMLIVAGRNYYAHEIEALANAFPGVLPGRSVAIGVDDPRTDATGVVILAECAPEAGATLAQEMRRHILEKLGLAVHAIVPLPRGRLIKTTSGKISRDKNKELYVAGTL